MINIKHIIIIQKNNIPWVLRNMHTVDSAIAQYIDLNYLKTYTMFMYMYTRRVHGTGSTEIMMEFAMHSKMMSCATRYSCTAVTSHSVCLCD